MTCVSDATSYPARAHIFANDGTRVGSGDGLKVLGFQLSSRSRMHAHVESLRRRFRKKYWCLYHLRKAGFTDQELAQVYCTIILPVADYCVVAYHSLLTDEQDQVIERLQAQALWCIYGPMCPMLPCGTGPALPLSGPAGLRCAISSLRNVWVTLPFPSGSRSVRH